MNFLTQKQELAAQLGMDQTDSDDNTLLGRWLNTSQRMIAGAADWPFFRATTPLIVQTVPDITTGTVSVTDGGTAATLSSAPAASTANSFIKFASSEDWFRITAHTAATTGLTIDPVAIDTNTDATYTIRKFFYSTSAAVDRILAIRQSITPYQLVEMGRDQFNEIRPDPDATGNPKMYMLTGLDSSGLVQFALWPTPDAEINLIIDYIAEATDLSSDSDVSIIPPKWHTSVMMEGAKWQGFDFLDDTRADQSKKLFYIQLEDMKKNMRQSKTQHRRFRPADELLTRDIVPFPENYPRV